MSYCSYLLKEHFGVTEVYGHQIGGAQVERKYMLANLRHRCNKEILQNAKGNRGEIASQSAMLDKCENPNTLLPNASLQKAYVKLKNKTDRQNGIKKLQQQQKEKYRDHWDGTRKTSKYLGSTDAKSHIDPRVNAYLKKTQ